MGSGVRVKGFSFDWTVLKLFILALLLGEPILKFYPVLGFLVEDLLGFFLPGNPIQFFPYFPVGLSSTDYSSIVSGYSLSDP